MSLASTIQNRSHRDGESGWCERLAEEVVALGLDAVRRHLLGRVAAHEQHGQASVVTPQSFDELRSTDAGHADISQDEIDPIAVERRKVQRLLS